MPYASDNQISKRPIEGGIEISNAQYVGARNAMLAGQEIVVRDGEIIILSTEKRTVYSTQDGSSQQISENEITPDGFTDDARPSIYHFWQEEQWKLNQAKLDSAIIEVLKERRDSAWRNATVLLTNGAVLKAKSRDDIIATINAMNITGAATYAGWCAENGVYDMSLDDFQEAVSLGIPKIAAAFDAYSASSPEYQATAYTSVNEAMDAFDSALEALQ